MRAMVLSRVYPFLSETDEPLTLTELPRPEPGRGEVLIRISVCGVCHTELDEVEGRTAPPRYPVVPGHEVVGVVEKNGPGASRFRPGDRVGVGWIFTSSGGENENLSAAFQATGRDRNGGYAEYMTVGESYAHPLPPGFSDVQAAPLLCAGAVGYRALRLTGLRDGGALGLTGFGGSAHLVLQMCRNLYPHSPLHVFARDAASRDFARELGAHWAGDTAEKSPVPLDAVIDTTPAWKPVVEALGNLKAGGRLVINAIRKEERDKTVLLELDYAAHLWMEKEIKSVANVTARDIAEFLKLAARLPLRTEVTPYPLEEANRALRDLKFRNVKGAKVLVISEDRN